MTVVTANDLNTKGISDIERLLREAQEVIISVRGKLGYVVMDIAHYDHLRECEIAAAWSQVREDVATGRHRRESTDVQSTNQLRNHTEISALIVGYGS